MSGAADAERETLIPRDTPIIQSDAAPLRLNIISGTAVLAQLGVWALAITVLYNVATTPLILVSLHPSLNVVALVLAVNAILLLQPTHTPAQKAQGTRAHSVLNALALSCILASASIIWYNKHLHGAAHYTSTHGKVGLTLTILLMVQVLVGLVQYYFPQLLGGEARAKKLYKWHRAVGYPIIALLILNVTLGTQTPWFLGKINTLWLWIVFDVCLVAGLVPRIKPAKMKLF